MAKATKDMEEFKAVSGAVGGDWEMEKKDSDSSTPNSRQSISNYNEKRTPPNPPIFVSPPPPGTIAPVTARNYRTIDYSKYGKYSGFQSSSGDAEMRRKRRMVKYQKYAAESGIKTSFRNGFRWVKNKYCQLIHGY